MIGGSEVLRETISLQSNQHEAWVALSLSTCSSRCSATFCLTKIRNFEDLYHSISFKETYTTLLPLSIFQPRVSLKSPQQAQSTPQTH